MGKAEELAKAKAAGKFNNHLKSMVKMIIKYSPKDADIVGLETALNVAVRAAPTDIIQNAKESGYFTKYAEFITSRNENFFLGLDVSGEVAKHSTTSQESGKWIDIINKLKVQYTTMYTPADKKTTWDTMNEMLTLINSY